MEISRSRIIGFCTGVKRAVEMAEQNRGAYVTGDALLHNPLETRRLAKDFAITPAPDVSAIPAGATALIRPHGVEESAENELRVRGVHIVDTTCPFVKNVQNLARQLSANGYHVFLFGDKGHAEVLGTASRAHKEITVFSSIDELKSLEIPPHVALISQTTKPLHEFQMAEKILSARAKDFKSVCTICPATRNNQEAAAELARRCDIMIIIGGKNSSNTKTLVSATTPYCSDIKLVESAADLKPEWFNDKAHCGIAAGLSTPERSIDDVENRIRELAG